MSSGVTRDKKLTASEKKKRSILKPSTKTLASGALFKEVRKDRNVSFGQADWSQKTDAQLEEEN